MKYLFNQRISVLNSIVKLLLFPNIFPFQCNISYKLFLSCNTSKPPYFNRL
uniref:Uncharacterized protein n=1 Tax=Siphoviridae sp. ctHjK2 TaxID=2827831 RepID=A0A8S5SR94_9CAUD|nr:MAG TPA: hypothetical protein [Siphoviridae sp. ctHjK2]